MGFRVCSSTARVVFLWILLAAVRAHGTVVLDGSMGGSGELAGPTFTIPLRLGKVVGTNLFDSFSQFDIAAGQSAVFEGSAVVPIKDVIARVTGGVAHIGGPITCIAGANLILVDQDGIIFGPKASLNVTGSFAATTASYVRLSGGGRFSAALGTGDSTLSSAAPAAFGFLTDKPSAISTTTDGSSPSGLITSSGQCLSLVGGAIQIAGAKLAAPGGRVNLVSVASPGEVAFNPADPASIPDVSAVSHLGPIDVEQNSSVAAIEGGHITVRGSDLTLMDSVFDADNTVAAGGGVDVALGGDLSVVRGRISAVSMGSGDGGMIRLHAQDISLQGTASVGGVPVCVDSLSSGSGGDIVVQSQFLSISDGAAMTAFTQHAGNGGSITAEVSRSILLDGTVPSTLTGFGAETFDPVQGGPGGNIFVKTAKLRIVSSAEITASTQGSGNAGSITLDVRKLSMDGEHAADPALIQARAGNGTGKSGVMGSGGRIMIHAGTITLHDGGVITTTTFGSGNGGNVSVHAGDVTIVGTSAAQFTGFFSRASPDSGAGGAGGGVTLNVRNLHLIGNAQVSAISTAGGATAGSIRINADSVALRHGASLTVQALSRNVGGSITIHASDGVEVLGHSSISAAAGSDGRVTIIAGRQFVANHSTITAQSSGVGGGEITIDPALVFLNHSVINGESANAPVRVVIGADSDFIRSHSQILSAAVTIPPEVDIAGSITLFMPTLDNAPALIPQCAARFALDNISSFIVTGRGGAPPEPGSWYPDLSLQPGANPPAAAPADRK